MDLTLLVIEQLVIHQLPKRKGAGPGVLSDTPTPLVPRVKHFFEDRIRTAIGDGGIRICFDDTSASPVPGCIRAVLSDAATPFLAVTRDIANELFQRQTDSYSEGLVCVANCSLGDRRAVAIMKLELEDGIRAELTGAVGHQHFEIVVVDDLMLTKNTRVFKVALFATTAGADVADLTAIACDTQRARAQLVAGYFLSFLGCRLADQPDVTTKRFLDVSEVFIRSVTDATNRAKYTMAVIAELNRNAPTLNPGKFAQHHLLAKDRAAFTSAMKEAGLALTPFHKDTALITQRINRARFDFENDLTLLAPSDALGKTVSLSKAEDGKARVEFTAHLKSTRGAN